MIRRPIDELSEEDLAALVENQVSEGRSLEFKRELPGRSDADVKEFLADVTSLANAQGGDLIFGIEDKDGVASKLSGIRIDDSDTAILRLDNILRDGVEPRLAGVRLRSIPIGSEHAAIVLRAPASLAAPHRIRFKNSGRFYNRNSRGKYEMDTHELRQAFTASEDFPSKLRQLHRGAVEASRGVDFPFELRTEPAVVFSVIPLSFLRDRLDIAVTEETAVLPPRIGGSITYLHTLEGILARSPLAPDNTVRSYALTHRSGRIDSAWTIGGIREMREATVRLVFPHYFREGLLDIGRAAISRLGSFGIESPWAFFATIMGIHDYRIGIDDYELSDPAWRHEVTFTEVIADEASEEVFRPMLDALPLAFGVPPSEYRHPA